MAEQNTNNDKGQTLVERWLEEQQRWQQTVLTYLDSMAKDDEFLVHLGNAMRGSLLAGKPYPTTPLPAPGQRPAKQEAQADERLDRILFTLHQIEGQLEDLRSSVDELSAARRKKPKAKRKTQRAKVEE